MKFTELDLGGLFLVELEPLIDQRGFFARSFCAKEFKKRGLRSQIAQCNVSFNASRGTLRGMHFQRPPAEEAKLVFVTSGAIYDVSLDLRPNSPTYLCWSAVELTASNRKAIYIPEGFAHGFQTLEDNTSVLYTMYEYFEPKCAGGVCHDDSAFNIHWPIDDPVLSEKDRSYPPFIP